MKNFEKENQWLFDSPKAVNKRMENKAVEYQNQLTKPAGSLGLLEDLAVRFCGLTGQLKPALEKAYIGVFAADHGIAKKGVSAFPQAVTAQMIKNFSSGGAAISVLAKYHSADLEVYDLGTVDNVHPLAGVIDARIAPQTAAFDEFEAMSLSQLGQALAVGKKAVDKAIKNGADIFISGDMGIGNTSAATAIASVILKKHCSHLVGPGTGLENEGIVKKSQLISKAILKHSVPANNYWGVLQTFGGFEIAALAGAYIRAGQIGLPVLVDGFICSVAALVAIRVHPELYPWLFFSHASTEPGYSAVVEAIDAKPILELQMRLGEASGAAVAFPIIQQAVALHGQMATFTQAKVAEKEV